NRQAVGTAGEPGSGQCALLDAGNTGAEQGKRAEEMRKFRHDQNSYRSANCMTRAAEVLVNSPKVEGVARLRFGVMKLTWLKTLNASPRMVSRWPSKGIRKLLLMAVSKLTEPGTRTIPRVPTVPGSWPSNACTAEVLGKMLGIPFSSANM